MKRGNTFILSGVWVFGLLLLIPYGSFAETQSDENYPDAIKCIVDKYVASLPKVKGPMISKWPFKAKEYTGLGSQFLWTSKWMSEPEEIKETYLGSLKVKSVERFYLERMDLEIWTMEKSIDVNRLKSMIVDLANNGPIGWGLPKGPFRFFVYENIFVLLWTSANMFGELVQKNACEIIKTCFDCSDIDDRFYGFVDNREKRCGCGKAKEAEKEQK